MKKMKTGIVGCGVISEIYLKNLTTIFSEFIEVTACADLNADAAKKRAQQFHIKHMTVEGLLDDRETELILNLTIPAAHYEISKKALLAGKHVYNEKPLAQTMAQGRELFELSRRQGLMATAAPDTFLGAGLQTCREIIDSGEIGEPVNAFGFMLSRGPESFHPNPAFFYQPGAGPLFDMGPYYFTALTALFGAAEGVRAIGKRQSAGRRVENQSSPLYHTEFPVAVDTFTNTSVQFKNGVIANVTASWDMPFPYWESGLPPMAVYGTKGSLTIPDPNTFGGISDNPFADEPGSYVLLRRGSDKPATVPVISGYLENSRGLGAAELAISIRKCVQPRVSGELSLHILELLHGSLEASATGEHYKLTTSCERPCPLTGLLEGI
jgi:predicted dehydrogenase